MFKYLMNFISLISILPMMVYGSTDPGLAKLQVEYQTQPLGIDIKQPSFSWQMITNPDERGQRQTAYQIRVWDEAGTETWNTGKVSTDISHSIRYSGNGLKASTRYTWQVMVWDNHQAEMSAESWFETGIMGDSDKNPAWSNAKWIGPGADDLTLYSHYLSVFKVEYTLRLDSASQSSKASFVIGANDDRLMHRELNLMGMQSGKDESYIAFELDISPINKNISANAILNIFRVGYHPDDNPNQPFRSFEISRDLINEHNQYKKHRIFVDCNFGLFDVYINDRAPENKISKDDPTQGPFSSRGLNLNPVGRGNNFISFPMLADIGYKLGQDQIAQFSSVEIKHFRFPSNAIFKEEIESKNYQGLFSEAVDQGYLEISGQEYSINGGENGVLILANPSHGSTPMFRTVFEVDQKISKARLYVTTRGIYEMYLNGERIGHDYFNPGLTQYNKTHMYQTYDVTNLLENSGTNVLGAWLSEGWWSGNITYSGENWNYFGDRQSLLCKLVVTYTDGSEKIVVSDPSSWKYYNEGPILYGSFFQGEVYDANLEARVDGWNKKGFSDTRWKPAVEIPLEGTTYQGTFTDFRGNTTTFNYDDFKLIGQVGENASIVKEIPARTVEEIRPGVFIYDLGQNMVGFPQIKIYNGKKGQKIFLRYAEVRYPDLVDYAGNEGMIMLENIRAALTQDIYILKGGDEIIQPRFTFHGFRFLEISGVENVIPIEDIKGMVVSSIKKLTADYRTSNELVNKLWENITWSLRGNFLSIPTDTPARNERMGWSGDINVFSKAATFLAQVNQFLKRHLLAMRDMQRVDGRFPDVAPVGGGFGGTLWGSAGIIVAWETFMQYGDTSLLREHYPAMKEYMEFLDAKIDPKNGVLNEGPLGDWLSPEGNKNDNTLFWTAYHAHNFNLMSKIATILGKNDEARFFTGRYEERKEFFNKTYVDPTSFKTIKSGVKTGFMAPPGESASASDSEKGKIIDTQASYAIPLAFDLFDKKIKTQIIKNFAVTITRSNFDDSGLERPEYSLMTGFIGTASLAPSLSENNLDSLAYRLVQQTSYPSWLYSVVNGATTIWERLNSYTIENGFGGNNSMNSFNHYSFGAVAAWMINYSLGIQRDPSHPAFKSIILNPRPDPDKKMEWAQGFVETMYGTISTNWRWKGNTLSYKVYIPANTSANLILPMKSGKIIESGVVLENSKGITILNLDDQSVKLNLESGNYHFELEF